MLGSRMLNFSVRKALFATVEEASFKLIHGVGVFAGTIRFVFRAWDAVLYTVQSMLDIDGGVLLSGFFHDPFQPLNTCLADVSRIQWLELSQS